MMVDRTRWRAEVATRCSLPVPYLLSPAEKEKLGAFQVVAFGQVFRAKNVTVGHLSRVLEENEDFWSTLSLGPSRGHCGAVSAG